jgi:hypothetical protein
MDKFLSCEFYGDIAHIVHECQVDISFSKESKPVISYMANSQSPSQKYNLELKMKEYIKKND